MFEEQSEEAIKQRMLDALPGVLDKREGAFIQDAISPAALELAMAYIELERILRLGFVQTTCGQYLDYKASERGLTRKEATRATGQAIISGPPGTLVPNLSLLATSSGIQFHTITGAVIGENGQTTVAIEAVAAGSTGNVPIAAINSIPVSIPGVTGVCNEEEVSGGTDGETDDALIARLLERVREPSASGNRAQYRTWAKALPGVGDIYVEPRWAGPNTIRIFLIDSNRQPASDLLVASVQEYLDPVKGQGEGKAPIDHFVTVVPAITKTVNIEAAVVKDATHSLPQLQEAFEAAVSAYLSSLAFSGNSSVKYTRIANYLFDVPGVEDYSHLTLNGEACNLVLSPGEAAVLGTVMLSG